MSKPSLREDARRSKADAWMEWQRTPNGSTMRRYHENSNECNRLAVRICPVPRIPSIGKSAARLCRRVAGLESELAGAEPDGIMCEAGLGEEP